MSSNVMTAAAALVGIATRATVAAKAARTR
jgi:hypothetical protein